MTELVLPMPSWHRSATHLCQHIQTALNITWPTYSLEGPKSIVFDANFTDMGYIEEDIYRAERIASYHCPHGHHLRPLISINGIQFT
jgi:hypothetical protein